MKRPLCALALVLSAGTARAWDFTPGTPCLLTHAYGTVSVELTYDPTRPHYTISITHGAPLPRTPVFSMRFFGSAPLTISTSQHAYSNGDRTVTVEDRGFENVLNGMQFNDMAAAMLGAQVIPVPLENAAGPVAAFRTCRGNALS